MTPEEFYADEHIDTDDGFESTKGGRLNPHRGVDINKHPAGTPVPALTPGIVVISEEHYGLGWIVEVQDDNGRFPGYRHLQGRGLPVGARVRAGDIVGKLGDTGDWSGGDHTCFTDGSGLGAIYGDPDLVRDPVPYIKAHRATPKPASQPIPTISEEDQEMIPVFAQDKNDSGAAIYLINSAGKKRPMPKSEWDARKASYAAAGLKVGVAKVSAESLKHIPNA